MTTRIHDLAAEFGISAEQLIGMLKEIDIFVRSHLSPLKPEQVAMMRARWEREKRKQKEPPSPPKRRRAAKAAEPAAVALEERPKRRRRTAAEMAVVEAEAQAEAALEAERELKAREALEATKPLEEEKPSLEERAAALFRSYDPSALQFGVRFDDRVRVHLQIDRELPHRRQLFAGLQQIGGDPVKDLVLNLPIDRHATLGVEVKLNH